MKQRTDIPPLDLAHFRFSLIAPVIQGLYEDKSEAAYYRRITKDPLRLPDGSFKKFSPSTLESWTTIYRKQGMDGLIPSPRCDKGTSRTIDADAAAEILRLREKFPRINGVLIHQKLVEDGFIPNTVSVRAVQRYLSENDLRSARNPEIRHRLPFEFPAFGCMWQADTAYLPYITEDGSCRRTYLVAILDDHSRMIVGAEIFYNDNAANFQKVLRNAILAYGIPDKLYLDNGSPYTNSQLTLILDSLGIVESHTPVRDGASKGKVERNFRTIRSRWLAGIDPSEIHSLDQFNTMLTAYVMDHNTRIHGGTGESPMDRFLRTKDHVRSPKSAEWVQECFHNRLSRKVRKDSTLTIDGVCYDVPPQFCGMNVEVRFLPGNPDSAYILYGKVVFPIRVTDKNANAYAYRNNHSGKDIKTAAIPPVPIEKGGIIL